jgi:DHA2 family multidrug resistance protein
VLTSYLVSNAIVLPISGWLASLFGRKRFFIVCIFIFTVASALCGSAASLNMLLLFRVIQGAGGGGLQPMAQAILADTFPPEKRGIAFALYGITAIMAPPSDRHWADGSPITIRGAGSSSSTCR